MPTLQVKFDSIKEVLMIKSQFSFFLPIPYSIVTSLVKSALLHVSYGPKSVKLPPFFSSP